MYPSDKRAFTIGLLSSTAIWLAAPSIALAQLDTITVTAQKREVSLQKTPAAVSALETEYLDDRGVTEIKKLGSLAPNLFLVELNNSSTDAPIFIRGLGQGDPILTLDPAVGIYLDGVSIARSTGASFELVDLERVEVIRGPAGTLFGRNTTGGAINLITAGPADEFGGSVKLGIGNFAQRSARVSLDTGDIGGSGIKIRASYVHNERDGYLDDISEPSDSDPGAFNTDAFRVTAEYDADGPFFARYSYDRTDTNSIQNPFQLAGVSDSLAAFLAQSPLAGGSTALVSASELPFINADNERAIADVEGHSLTMEYNVDDNITLRSISGWRAFDHDSGDGDLDGNSGLIGFLIDPILFAGGPFTPLGFGEYDVFNGDIIRGSEQITQEFNIVGEYDRFNFVLGGFFFTEDSFQNGVQDFIITFPIFPTFPVPSPVDGTLITIDAAGVPLTGLPLDFEHSARSIAGFGQATYSISDRWRVTGGLRYTSERRELDQTTPAPRQEVLNFDDVTWVAGTEYDFSDDVFGYVRVSTGFRSGGFNPRDGAAAGSFAPETATSYEAGLKTELFDSTLRLNMAGFYTKQKDIQITQIVPGTGGAVTDTTNAGEATIKGFELEFLAQPTNQLTINGSVGYQDFEFKEFIVLDPATDTFIDRADEARPGGAPDLTATVGVQYSVPIDRLGTLSTRVDWNYRGDVAFVLFPGSTINPIDNISPAHSLVDARVALSDIPVMGESDLEVSFFVRNLFDEEYIVNMIDFGEGLGIAGYAPGLPRTFGGEISISF